MNFLTVAVPVLRPYLHELIERPPGPVRCPVGVSRWAGQLALLMAAPGREVGRVLLLAWSDPFTVPRLLPPDCAGVLLLGHGRQRGRARGVVRLPSHSLAPLHCIRCVGPGMYTVSLQQGALPESLAGVIEGLPEESAVRWSRTIGALGRDAWQRLIGLRYAIVGVGRTGSSVGQALVRLGVRRLTLIDPDQVELHNLGEMVGVTVADLGRPKVEALAASLAALAPERLDRVRVRLHYAPAGPAGRAGQ